MDAFFTINGKPYQVNAKTVGIDTSLNTFIRTKAQLSGTKFMCSEGGCGACIVNVKGIHPVTKENKTWAVNSCLTSVFSCHGLEVTTVEGVGNRHTGYHTIQKRLAHLNGTQCGYCSPGMVMNMYSLLQSKNGKVSMEEIENSFGGNVCRCTGYRPILDAFKSLAFDADKALIDACVDIEDLNFVKTCPKTGSPCAGLCQKAKGTLSMVFDDEKRWHKVSTVPEIFNILDNCGSDPYMLVAGNTAHGVYRRNENLKYFIDITGVETLRSHEIGSTELVLGANVSLTETMEILTNVSNQIGFEYCKNLVDHIDLIANVPVRNAGTIAGNLSIKHGNVEFPSDMFIILEAAGAEMTIASGVNKTNLVSVADYIHLDMNKKIILNVILPKLDPKSYTYRSYKVMPRAQNSHAYVNAGFLFELSNGSVKSARICFGGIAPEFVHADKMEKFFVGKKLYDNETLQSALQTLTSELNPDWVLPDASPEYRKNLAAALFYKFVLNTCPTNQLNGKYISGGTILNRAISSGTQSFDTFKERYPLTEKVPKYEGLIQCSGELQYVNDVKPMDGELFAAFVQATDIHSVVESIDPSDALSLPGVEFFFSADDIPGENNFMPAAIVGAFGSGNIEQIFLSKENPVLYNGQPVGVILADTFALANKAAKKVKITYKQPAVKTPIITSLHDAHEKKATERYHPISYCKITPTVTDLNTEKATKVVGTFDIGAQYHYTMEPQTTLCIPAEDGIEVISATQWVHLVQIAVSRCLNIPNNQVNMGIRRLGGAYGCKGTRATHVACAAAISCKHTNRPIRFVMTLEANMEVMGKRYALLNEYDVDVDDNGRILKMVNNFAQDFGCSMNDGPVFNTINHVKNVYVSDTWDVQSSAVITDAASHTYCRAPGTTEGLAMIENIMEHIARVTGKDPLSVRMANMPENHKMRTMLPEFLKSIDFDKRKSDIEEFNRNNRWRKRGLAFVPMEYPQPYFGLYPALVAIYSEDGTVAVTHGGVECGQGINTKVAQVVAHCFKIPLSYVSIKRMDNVTGANSFCTGGSMTSEAICMAVKKACETLLERMKPVRDELGDNPTWKVLTQACYDKLIDLSCKSIFDKNEMVEYTIWGCSCAEVEVDILTGNLQLTRVDILEDTGESMSPGIDIGQVEGAFVMGIGYWLTESLVYGAEKGELLSNRTWHYKPPGAKDIPIDFRVTFLHNSSNAGGVLRSKATGEPPLCMSVVVIFALRHALESARKDAGIVDWFEMGAPSTPDKLFLNAGNSLEHFKLQ